MREAIDLKSSTCASTPRSDESRDFLQKATTYTKTGAIRPEEILMRARKDTVSPSLVASMKDTPILCPKFCAPCYAIFLYPPLRTWFGFVLPPSYACLASPPPPPSTPAMSLFYLIIYPADAPTKCLFYPPPTPSHGEFSSPLSWYTCYEHIMSFVVHFPRAPLRYDFRLPPPLSLPPFPFSFSVFPAAFAGLLDLAARPLAVGNITWPL